MGVIEDERFRKFGAVCLFFDRYGGVSKSPFDSLNVGYGGDEKENVLRNLELVREIVGARQLGLVKQVHSNRVVRWIPGKIPEADGIYTSEPLIFVGVKVADCMPIVMLDVRNCVICSVHAGWRGSAGGVVMRAVDVLLDGGASPNDIIVSFGPHICGECYEVGEDVAGLFPEECVREKDGRLLLDLSCVNKGQLIERGVPEENIRDLGICTYENKDFFSYRREGVCGRNIGGGMVLGKGQAQTGRA